MVHVCCVLGCSTRLNKEVELSFFSLPLNEEQKAVEVMDLFDKKNKPSSQFTYSTIENRHLNSAMPDEQSINGSITQASSEAHSQNLSG